MFSKAFFAGVVALLATTVLAGDGDARCQRFKQHGQPYFAGRNPIRISRGIACTSNDCTLDSVGYVSYGPWWNKTLDSKWEHKTESIRFTFERIADLVKNMTFNTDIITGQIPSETLRVPDGDNSYVSFTETYQCVTGVMSACAYEFPINNGEWIEACSPTTLTGGDNPTFNGTRTLVNVTAAEANSYTSNPYGSESDADSNVISSLGVENANAGMRLHISWAAVLGLATLVAAFLM